MTLPEKQFACQSKFPCKFKQFSMNGAKCTLEESLPKYVHAFCEKAWNINVLHWEETESGQWVKPIKDVFQC